MNKVLINDKPKQKTHLAIGQLWENHITTYILCCCGESLSETQYQLTALDNGSRYSFPSDTIEGSFGDNFNDFKRVHSVTLVDDEY